MPYVIGMVSQKGGAGKSTLARLLARELARNGIRVKIARAAHAVVVPTGQTKDDLRPAVQLAHSLADAGIEPSRITFALVKTTRSAAEVFAARTYLEQTDYTLLDGELPISTAYGIAHDRGKRRRPRPRTAA